MKCFFVFVFLILIDHLRRKVRSLRETVRRRDRKIKTLQEALDECKKCKLLSDEAHEVLIDTFNPIARELFLNEVHIVQDLMINVVCGLKDYLNNVANVMCALSVVAYYKPPWPVFQNSNSPGTDWPFCVDLP